MRHDVDGLECNRPARERDVAAARTARRVQAENARPAANASIVQTVLNPWPAEKEVRGVLTLRLRPDQTEGLAALCYIKHDVFTMCVESRQGSGFGPIQGLELAKIHIAKLVLILRPGQKDGFSVGYEGHHEVDIYCQARDNLARNKWISVFRRLGVLVCAHLGESHDDTPSRKDESSPVVVYPRKAVVRSGPMVDTTRLHRSGTR